MAKRQTRRSISIKGETYRRFAARCEQLGRPVSGHLEDLIAPHIEGIPDPGPVAPRPRPAPEPPSDGNVEELRKAAFGS